MKRIIAKKVSQWLEGSKAAEGPEAARKWFTGSIVVPTDNKQTKK
ncbi:hypothetical protein [Paenibacillus sambharensis]|nr:hypothetical protein [Paenibacillus sambharensis]